MEEATTKMARIPNDPLELQAHVLMLRNQLLFEKVGSLRFRCLKYTNFVKVP